MKTILVIDDVEYVRRNISKALEDHGYTVYIAENGKIGSEIIREKQIDVLITDIMMPEKSGIEILMDLKEELSNTKIIIITGQVSPDADSFKNLVAKYGASAILYKPFKRQALIDTVDKILKTK